MWLLASQSVSLGLNFFISDADNTFSERPYRDGIKLHPASKCCSPPLSVNFVITIHNPYWEISKSEGQVPVLSVLSPPPEPDSLWVLNHLSLNSGLRGSVTLYWGRGKRQSCLSSATALTGYLVRPSSRVRQESLLDLAAWL